MGRYANSDVSTLSYSRCLCVLIRLPLGLEHKGEYVRTFMVARLLNQYPWFSCLPGVPFHKEPREAMLSCVVAKMACYPTWIVLSRYMTCLCLLAPHP